MSVTILHPWRIYVSGAISGMDREAARGLFKTACNTISATGHIPVNPMEIPYPALCPCEVPVEGHHTWACSLRKDIRVLIDCNALLLLPNWTTSKGAALESDLARRLDIPVYFEIASLPVIRADAKVSAVTQ